MKTLAFVQHNDTRFAVGDFSPVLSVFSYHELSTTPSPFLLLDHIGPGRLLPGRPPGGVHEHPHRGFETVTIVYAGELEHRDSSGGGGLIGPGDVQWMTAAHGVIHRELFSPGFAATGGPFEMVQLWVNLPAADKMNPARYQSLSATQIPCITLPDDAGQVRVIAGHWNGTHGPADTHTRMNVLDVRLAAGAQATFTTEDGDTALVYLLAGRLRLSEVDVLEEQAMAVMSAHGTEVAITAEEGSRLLVLTGAPLGEPLNGHGPFVMNTYDEILQAYEDIKAGRLIIL
ncbi:MAG: pirin family protein [Moraxellaceae bacterium]|nr:pirin family protein [Moraxellaceae bacterium]